MSILGRWGWSAPLAASPGVAAPSSPIATFWLQPTALSPRTLTLTASGCCLGSMTQRTLWQTSGPSHPSRTIPATMQETILLMTSPFWHWAQTSPSHTLWPQCVSRLMLTHSTQGYWQLSLDGVTPPPEAALQTHSWRLMSLWPPMHSVILPTVGSRSEYMILHINVQSFITKPFYSYHICAADSGKDSCQGDSGGPLFLTENGRFEFYKIIYLKSPRQNPSSMSKPRLYQKKRKGNLAPGLSQKPIHPTNFRRSGWKYLFQI